MEKFHWKNSFSFTSFIPPSLSLCLSFLIPTLSFSLFPLPPHSSSFFSLSLSLFLHTSIPYFIVFCFIQYTIFAGTVFFTSWKSVVSLLRASLSVLFSNSICSLCVSTAHFIHAHNMANFFVINTIFIISSIFMVICDQYSLMVLL